MNGDRIKIERRRGRLTKEMDEEETTARAEYESCLLALTEVQAHRAIGTGPRSQAAQLELEQLGLRTIMKGGRP